MEIFGLAALLCLLLTRLFDRILKSSKAVLPGVFKHQDAFNDLYRYLNEWPSL